MDGNSSEFIHVFSENDIDEAEVASYPSILPILPLRNTVLFPGVIIPISVGREKSMQLIHDVNATDNILGIVTQKEEAIDDPKIEDLYLVGCIAQILRVFQLPDGSTSVIIQGKKRFEIIEVTSDKPYITAQINPISDIVPPRNSEFDAIISSLKEHSIKIIQLSTNIPPEIAFAVNNIKHAGFLINFVTSSSDISFQNKQLLLETDELDKRALKLLEFLSLEIQKLQLKDNIQTKVRTELDQKQKEYYLNQQLKAIRTELGDDPSIGEIEELKEKAKLKKWDKTVSDTFYKELGRLERINSASPDYSNQITYLQVLLELPWNEYTPDNFDLKRATKILDKDHYGLDNVKERILEHLAVLKLKGDLKSPIICLYGPPGVGKTSLGKSIAEALKRKYVRMSLGGLHDEAEIRGHRKTYIGAMPGRIIQNLRKTKSSNPVFVLDEIDKIGNDFRGDPAFALLEVLDPEQNCAFYDNYLELEYDLSKILFIATANSLAPIKPALLDRMEIIHVSGYIVEEKIEIARKHLIPKQLELHGIKPEQLKFSKPIIESIVENYTRESGVRELAKKLAKIARHYAKKIGMGESYDVKITNDHLINVLGTAEYHKGQYETSKYAGVVTGLSWTPFGGRIMYIETSLSRGKGQLTLTGSLGDVMKESAIIALEYIKAHTYLLGIKDNCFERWNVHIHVPEGAIPKDGPSAGITLATSLASAFTQRKVKPDVTMTGEITLRGKVMPVGGIKEKILAAKRAGITQIILSSENEKDINKVKEIYRTGLTFHFVNDVSDVLALALLNEKVANPLQID